MAVGVLMAGLSACSDDSTSSESAVDGTDDLELPATVECGTQYRPDAESLADAEERTITVERPSGLDSTQANASFAELRFEIVYRGGPDGRSVSIVVSSPAGREIERVLYQLAGMDALPSFPGGHGFTGLHYVSAGAAQLQWWCDARP